jgi:hypothetical protein
MIDVHVPSKTKEPISVGRFLDFKRFKFFRYISTILLEKNINLTICLLYILNKILHLIGCK